MTSITPSPEMVERAKQSVLSEMSDRRLLNGVDDDLHDEIAAAIVQACLPALSCPDGFRLVPVEPTAEMVRCGEDALRKSGSGLSQLDGRKAADRIYRAMLAASPAPAVDNAGWRPIASFPKDGELYLVCDDRSLDGDHQVVFWDEDLETPFKLHTPDGPAFHEAAFTHWQPLPSAPSQDAPPPRSLSNKD